MKTCLLFTSAALKTRGKGIGKPGHVPSPADGEGFPADAVLSHHIVISGRRSLEHLHIHPLLFPA